MVTPAAKREAVAHLGCVFEVSERRACSVLGTDRSSVRYRSIRPDDAGMRTRLRELASQRRRFGYRRLHILLTREGLIMNHNKLRRLYREEGLQVRRRCGRKRALGTRAPMALPQGANQRWSLDFAADAFSDGRRFRILAIVDDFTRECLALVADTSLPGLRVVRELDTLVSGRGRPAMCVSDNGTELTSMARGRVALHRSRQAAAECFCRVVHRATARRVAERDAVQFAQPRAGGSGDLEKRLQHGAAAQRHR